MKKIVVQIKAMILSLAAASSVSFAQEPDLEAVEIKTLDLGAGIYMLVGYGGNIGVSVGEDGVFVIDDQLAVLAPKILAAISKITDKPVDFLINTHWHGDHTGGNMAIAAGGAVIVSHDNVRVRMAAGGPEQSPPGALPVVTFSDTVTFHFNGHEILATHPVDAHTDGDAVIQFTDIDIIHAGDILFNGMYPFIDIDSGGSIDGYIAALESLENLAGPDTRIIAGHGTIASRQNVQKTIVMLKAARARILSLIDETKSLDEVLRADPLADFHDEWAWSFITGQRMTEIMYRGLSVDQ